MWYNNFLLTSEQHQQQQKDDGVLNIVPATAVEAFSSPSPATTMTTRARTNTTLPASAKVPEKEVEKLCQSILRLHKNDQLEEDAAVGILLKLTRTLYCGTSGVGTNTNTITCGEETSTVEAASPKKRSRGGDCAGNESTTTEAVTNNMIGRTLSEKFIRKNLVGTIVTREWQVGEDLKPFTGRVDSGLTKVKKYKHSMWRVVYPDGDVEDIGYDHLVNTIKENFMEYWNESYGHINYDKWPPLPSLLGLYEDRQHGEPLTKGQISIIAEVFNKLRLQATFWPVESLALPMDQVHSSAL